jgi:predicted DNA-binding protein (MmcQ/YjbR family)
MKQSDLEKSVASLGAVTRDAVSQPGLVLFKTKLGKIFAMVHNASQPLRVEAKCDQQLAKVLRDRYETVLPSQIMEASSWNEIICTGQLTDEEVVDLLRLSFQLVAS